MSGHSKWSQIKRQKGAADQKRSGVFTKLSNAIVVAVREGGKNPDMNVRLRLAIDKAREANMPNDNVERAIKRGAGELGGAMIESVTYEGFGPAGSTLIIEALTDNKNRAASEIRSTLAKHGGRLGTPNTVRWQFETRGYFEILGSENIGRSPEDIELALIEAGTDDIEPTDLGFEAFVNHHNFTTVRDAITSSGIKLSTAEIRPIPTTPVVLSEADQAKLLSLMGELDDLSDIDAIYTNANV
ncbi:MAG: YebC/PmpR family DNA-binding transcriptional regulator [Patescibacteria group bacterium]|jgi:YebC/PmpR family DNA-binding regulatory protein